MAQLVEKANRKTAWEFLEHLLDLFGEASYATRLSSAGDATALSANAGLKMVFYEGRAHRCDDWKASKQAIQEQRNDHAEYLPFLRENRSLGVAVT